VRYRTERYGPLPGLRQRRAKTALSALYATRRPSHGFLAQPEPPGDPGLACVERAIQARMCQHSLPAARVLGLRPTTPTRTYEIRTTSTASRSTSIRIRILLRLRAPVESTPLCRDKSRTVLQRMAMPECWVHHFERYGFYWLGHDELEDTMHFESWVTRTGSRASRSAVCPGRGNRPMFGCGRLGCVKMRKLVCSSALGWLLALASCSGDTTHSGSPGNGTGGGSPGPVPTVQPGTGAVSLDSLAHELTCDVQSLDPLRRSRPGGNVRRYGREPLRRPDRRSGSAAPSRRAGWSTIQCPCVPASTGTPGFSCDYANESTSSRFAPTQYGARCPPERVRQRSGVLRCPERRSLRVERHLSRSLRGAWEPGRGLLE